MIIQNKIKRAVSVDQIEKMSFDTLPFEGKWLDHVGTPEPKGTWIIWGHSGNGKTRFTLKLAKYLSNFGKVAYNTLEEGLKLSFQKAVKETNFKPVKGKFMILNQESYEELMIRLKKQRSPEIIIIDSLQFFGINQKKFTTLVQKFPSKLFIFISHAEGKDPKGTFAQSVRYHSDVKIRVEGYKAFPISRYGGGQPFTIWDKGAEDYWGLKKENQTT